VTNETWSYKLFIKQTLNLVKPRLTQSISISKYAVVQYNSWRQVINLAWKKNLIFDHNHFFFIKEDMVSKTNTNNNSNKGEQL